MKKKSIGIIIILCAIIGILFSISIYAGTGKLYTNLTALNQDGVGYGIGDPNNYGEYLWHMSTYDSQNGDLSSEQKNIYCLQANYGESWETITPTTPSTIVEYNMVFDLQNERESLSSKIVDIGNDADDILKNLLDVSEDVSENEEQYRKILWLLDNIYIKGENNVEEYLARMGLEKDVYEGVVEYYNPQKDTVYGEEILTEADIIAIQRAAIWTITNGGEFDKTANINWLNITSDGTSYSPLERTSQSRDLMATDLYNYLVKGAEDGQDQYTADNEYQIKEAPVSIDESNVKTTKLDANYCLVGPIVIKENNDLLYTITMTLTDNAGAEITSSNYTITDKTGNKLEYNKLNNFAGNEEGFYIKLPREFASEVNIKMDITYGVTEKNLWLVGTESLSEIQVNAEQPIVEITREQQTTTIEFTSTLKEFDLALRKYITAVKGTNVVDTRVPNISLEPLLTETTASYKHRKDPVVVKNGDIVTYKITVYNEGEKAGYASQIIDQLPKGLKYVDASTITSNKNTYDVTYDETNNKLTFSNTTKTSLNKYETNTLDSETIEFTCEVTETSDNANDKILTNVAWISGAYDSESNIEIIDIGDDRDSRPQTSPSVTATTIEGFKGNSNNKIELFDSTYHYEGEQDDDDFEKLVLEPEIEITVTKSWNDNNDQDGLRPDEVTLILNADGVEVARQTVNKDDGWSYTFKGLPLKNNGVAIVYSAEESYLIGDGSVINAYSTDLAGDAETGFTITNTHTPETVEVSGTKTWDDNNDQDGLRPESITINLLADEEKIDSVTVQADENGDWKYSFTDLPKYKDGKEITYTITEDEVEDYTTNIDGYNVTNTHIPELIDIPIEKKWEDNDNQDGIRPQEITIILEAYVSPTQRAALNEIETIKLNSENGWKHIFENLPKYSNGNELKYVIRELNIEGYISEVTGDMTTGYIITNTHTPETIEISGTKTWDDNNDQDGLRPESIIIRLLANGTEVQNKTVTTEDSWTWTFENLPKYQDGQEITYTITEDAVENYTTNIDGYNVTNTHTPELIDIPVEKKWEDNDNQDGIRPQEITITLGAYESYIQRAIVNEIETITLKGETEWKHIFKNLPKYSNGNKLEYVIIEGDIPEGYTSEVTGDMTTGYIITNIHTPETVEISGTKTWDDNNDQDGLRPESIIIRLLANGTEVQNKTVTTEDSWTWTFGNLPKYEKGQEITYTITEDEVENYTTNIDGYNVTNTHTPETVEVSGTKTWNDNNDQDRLRPESITINLLVNGIEKEEKVVTASEGWTWTFTSLPKYEEGQEITYTITEDEVENYTTNIDGYDVTNTHTPETVEISGTKTWDDNNDQDGLRPESITIRLLANGTEKEEKVVTASEGWAWTFENLPKYEEGQEITYTIAEDEVENYTTNVDGYNVTNIHIPETTSVNVKKIWNDGNNQDGKRPDSITIILLANNQEAERITLSDEGNEWSHTFVDLPKYKNAQEISYTVQETGIPQGYTSDIQGTAAEGYIITNSYTPETINIPVTKVWNDNENQDGIRPEEITVQLYANEVAVDGKILTLKPDNSWTQIFENLPKYESGQIIQYTIKEQGVPTGYTSLVSGSMSTGYTITNTYTPGLTSVKVTKVWNDNNNQDGIRPESVNISLLANEKEVQKIDLNESNNWQYIFTNLPIKQNGQDIVYTITENTQIDGYTTTITNNNVTATAGEIQTASAPEYTITNTHETDEISITVNKEWQDENNYEGIRPTSVVVNIKNGETIVNTVTLSDENNWTHTFENLPAKENGVDINYVIEEIEPEGYTADIVDNGDNTYTITNTHIPEKIFDLALRKYIIKINNNELTTLGLTTRVPNISEETLQNGTTARYKHRKDPIHVEENDIITYAITIYNEGEKAGYASQIIDQLPTGLIYNPSTTVISKDANGAEKNTYTVEYEASTNKVTFDIINTTENPAKELQSYEQGNLDSETIEIKCKVVYKPVAGEKNILTNVAWINEAYDAEDNKEITDNIGDDRDSEPGTKPNVNKDNMEDYIGNKSNEKDLTNDSYYYQGEQDDDDFEKIYVKTFDLSLRKFVNKVNSKELEQSREPQVDITPLKNGTGTTAIYNHSKTPISLKVGDTVTYTIRVYNEGEIDGYANEVKDYLPSYLEYLENSTINKKYGWNISEDGRIATTTYLSQKEILAFNGTTLDYEDLQIECKIAGNAIPDERITNIAEISEYKYGDTVVPEDIDSESNNIDENLPEDKDLPKYKEDKEKDTYVPGNEDDDDFEKVYVKEFDLALRKFITQVQNREITNRIPQVKDENRVISYEHPKDAISVHVGDIVIYTLRIYNEGEIDGYASEITDDIPEYLEYLPEDSTNVQYIWKMYDENGNETENVEEAVKVKTTYLSKENGENNMIKAYDGQTLYYRDIQIAFKVKDPNSNTQIITNYAQISNDTDEDGNDIEDKDSKTDKWNEGEDDQDIENVKVEYFDLSILKFVSKVIIQENGTEKITETGYNGHENPEPVVKVELHKKKLNNVVVKFGYGITVTNEGDIPGYATELTDYVPEGLKFEATDNPNWTDEGNGVISTKQLENKLLQPGESETVEVIFTWINGSENLALKTNIVEISDDKNEFDVPDRDSTPDNKQDGEDDIDLAKVILTITTGAAKTYFTLTLGLLGVVAVGVILIKKFVI